MKPRRATFDRRTTETQIAGALTIDGSGRYEVRTGIRFFDHMLELFTRHGGFDLTLRATGDLDVDQHHTVEDVGIVLGETVLKALGDRRARQRSCQGSLRTLESPPRRGRVQGVRPRAARGVREGRATGEDAAEHQGPSVRSRP
jgi:imidazoleglycerol phosphate dehydratase HisB